MANIVLRSGLVIGERAINLTFVRASGPGGQNVNKVSSAVQLRFDPRRANLQPAMSQRLRRLAGKRWTSGDTLVIEAKRYRSQERNRTDALGRLATLLERANEAPKPRKSTRLSRAAKRRRLETKQRRSRLKKLRDTPRE